MDTFTHGFAGYLIGRAGLEQKAGRRATAASVIGAILPDADHFVELAGSAPYLEFHRGWTHSVIAALVWGGLSAWLLGRGRPGRARAWIGAAGVLGVASHILLDCVTAFGTVWLVPFSSRRFAFDWVFLLDPTFTGILLAAMVAGWLRPARAARRAQWGLAAIAAYLALCAWNHAAAWARVDALAAARWPDVRRTAALPRPPHAFAWRGLVLTAREIHEVRLNLLGGGAEWLAPVPAADLDALPRPWPRDLAALAGMARFLSEERRTQADSERRVFFDRQFAAIPGRRAYEVTLTLDRAGRITGSEVSDASVGARTALFVLLAAYVAACMRRWERDEAAPPATDRTAPTGPAPARETPREDPPEAPAAESPRPARRWQVWRMDDNGTRVALETFAQEQEARDLARRLESHGHKQTYWVEPED